MQRIHDAYLVIMRANTCNTTYTIQYISHATYHIAYTLYHHITHHITSHHISHTLTALSFFCRCRQIIIFRYFSERLIFDTDRYATGLFLHYSCHVVCASRVRNVRPFVGAGFVETLFLNEFGPHYSFTSIDSSGATFRKSLSNVRPMSKSMVACCPKIVQTIGLSEICPKTGF